MPSDFEELHAQAQQNRIDFLKVDLEPCFTFADLLDTEIQMGDVEGVRRLKEKAERGHDTIAHLLMGVDEGIERDFLQRMLTELRARLDAVAGRL